MEKALRCFSMRQHVWVLAAWKGQLRGLCSQSQSFPQSSAISSRAYGKSSFLSFVYFVCLAWSCLLWWPWVAEDDFDLPARIVGGWRTWIHMLLWFEPKAPWILCHLNSWQSCYRLHTETMWQKILQTFFFYINYRMAHKLPLEMNSRAMIPALCPSDSVVQSLCACSWGTLRDYDYEQKSIILVLDNKIHFLLYSNVCYCCIQYNFFCLSDRSSETFYNGDPHFSKLSLLPCGVLFVCLFLVFLYLFGSDKLPSCSSGWWSPCRLSAQPPRQLEWHTAALSALEASLSGWTSKNGLWPKTSPLPLGFLYQWALPVFLST